MQGLLERMKLTQPTQQPLTSVIAKNTTDPRVIMKVTAFKSYYKLNSFRISTKLCTAQVSGNTINYHRVTVLISQVLTPGVLKMYKM